MTSVYNGGQDAVDSLKVRDERGEKVTKNSLKQFEGIMYPCIHNTKKSLQRL